ncbi:MAG TPA: protein kinase [Candidatus Polarisedimenticolaceae bacterium]|nr:protein kinase [Candidatus Polarisedimenticolaceae bacterium]
MNSLARTLQPEDQLSHYRVVGPLGTGGMGEVYLAQDQALERNVALKVLPAEFVRDDERLRRFVLEAKSASSLSHPNIVTIYEIGRDVVRTKGAPAEGDSAPVQFISMELINGRTMTTLIHEERTDLRTLLGYLAQAAEGLAKAHAAGIVHRDLKPGNIMVSADGFAKVLDFGLAKLTERTEPEIEMTNAPTMLEQKTGAGSILGTTGYMSPEQVRGKPVDARSDIFSFGCVLYEAITKTRPFVAETAVETMHKILNDPFPPIEERNPKAPPELRRFVRRCLAKSPDQRVQSMKDAAIELREIVDEWDNLTSTATSIGTTKTGTFATARSKPSFLVLAGAAVVALAAVAVAVWALKRGGSTADPSQPFQNMKMVTQTDRGDLTDVAISRDGRYFAYLTGELGKAGVRVRQVATGSDLEVVPSEDGLFEGLSFTPDGNYLFYLKCRRDNPSYRALMQVPSLGGPSRERAFDVDSTATFSPDGKQVAFVRGEPQKQHALIVVRDLEAGKERTLATVTDPRKVVGAPAWSPDGAKIAAMELDASSGIFVASTVTYDATSGAREVRETLKGAIPQSVAWLADGKGLVRTGYDLASALTRQIALVDFPSGRARRITNDVDDYAQVSVSSGDEAIAAVRRSILSDLWLADAGGGEPRALTSYRNAENSPFGASACPDGSVLFAGPRSQSLQIYSVAAAGAVPKPLTEGTALAVAPSCFAQGFVHNRFDTDGRAQVWRADADGGNARNLTPDGAYQVLDVARDGSIMTVTRVDDSSIWTINLKDGATRKLGPRLGVGRLSRDGKRAVVTDLAIAPSGMVSRAIKALSTGGDADPVNLSSVPPQGESFGWAPDGTAVTFVDRGQPVWNLYRAPLAGGPSQPITAFKEGRISDYAFSPDGRKLAVALTIGDANNLWIANADGSKPVQATRFPKDFIFAMTWMPDNMHVAVNAGKASSDAVLIKNFR